MALADYVSIAANFARAHPWTATCLVVVGAGIAHLGRLMAMLRPLHRTKPPVDCENQSDPVPNEDYAKKSKTYHTNSDDDCMRFLYDDCRTLCDVIARGRGTSGNGHCLGKLNEKRDGFDWIDYEQVSERVTAFGAGLLSLGLPEGTGTKLGIYASNGVEYVLAEFGAYTRSMIVVPLYDTLGPNACTFIINQADIQCVIVDSLHRLEAIISQASHLITLKHIVVIDDIAESYKSKAISFGFKVHTIEQVEEMGRKNPRPAAVPRPRDLAVICYTSGTTGNPKGAMLSHENILANVSSVVYQLGDVKPMEKDTYMSFLPLAHMFERCCIAAMLMQGGRIGFSSGDIRRLCDDMKILKPTVIPCVPRLCNRIHDKVFTMVKGNRVKEWLLRKALESKQCEVDRGIIRNNGFWDKIVFKNVRNNMGGNLRLVVVGSAPLSTNVLNFMRCALGCVLVEGYGQTESVSPCTMTLPGDPKTGHVGPPLASAYVKLVDVPDMEYYARDGSGEVCVKGPIVFQGYYKDPTLTAEAIDNEGWLHTGDIGTWLPNGTLKIVDRKKHIFKLSQGEYIAPEKIEGIYSRSSFVSQIFVYGESLKASLVAIVVPENDMLFLWARKHNVKGTVRDFCDDPRVKQAVLDDLHDLGKKDGLKSFEQVKDICLHPEQFSVDNGLLTPTLKTKRPECRKFFVKQIEALYRSID